MTGLDKILAEIKTDSDNLCSTIESETDARCEAIIKEAEAKALKITSDGDIEADKVYDEIITRAKSSAQLEARSVLLHTKQDIITQSLESAKFYLCNLPVDEYFSLIYKMIKKYSEKTKGVICLSGKDIDRLPADFEDKLKLYANGSLSLCDVPVEIDGGFVLVYGAVEVNCAFSSVFLAEAELFTDEVSKLLFS